MKNRRTKIGCRPPGFPRSIVKRSANEIGAIKVSISWKPSVAPAFDLKRKIDLRRRIKLHILISP